MAVLFASGMLPLLFLAGFMQHGKPLFYSTTQQYVYAKKSFNDLCFTSWG